MVSCLRFKSLSCFDFVCVCVYGRRMCCDFDLHMAVQLSQYHLLKKLFPFCIFLTPLVKILTIAMWVYF